MALRMDSGVHHAPTHHRTALPKRSSPPEADSPAPRKAAPPPTGSGRSPVVATRRKGGQESSDGSSTGSRSDGVAATAGSVAGTAGEAAGGGSAGKAVAGPRESDKRSGAGSIGSGSDGGGGNSGSGSGADSMYSTARKRVRIADAKLGEFAVMLQPYNGDHNDICEVCDKGGPLLCCDFCNLVYHLNCAKLSKEPSEELWICPACTTEVTARQISKRRRMAEDGSRGTSPGPGLPGYERPTIYHGVKAENDAFRAFILYKNQSVDIGLYPAAEDAARAYDRKALSLFGDAAVCNFPADEQVEVEAVGADGNTVKGVVRSFHQWRAEMQWGNKKRHLGFFERLDHASYAYNRAALYMNGSDTPLNVIKEGYVGPPLTGLPVRVPRNKLFVQQLPLPLASIAQARGKDESLQLARRRRQMAGQYHAPLVGDNHQVSFLPPLPPPSRARPPPLTAMTAVLESTPLASDTAPLEEKLTGVAVHNVDSGTAASNDSGESVTKLEENMIGPAIQSVTDASGRKDDASLAAAALVPSGSGSTEVAENAVMLSPALPSPPRLLMPSKPVAVYACPGVMIRDLVGNAQGTDGSSSPGSSVYAAYGDTTEAQGASPKTDSENTVTNVDPETPDTTTSAEATTPSPAGTPTMATIKDEYEEPRRTGTPVASLNENDCSVEARQDPTTAARGVAMSASAILPSMDPYFEANDIAHFGTLSATAAKSADGTSRSSADEAESTCIDTKDVPPLSRSQPGSATEAINRKPSEEGPVRSSEAGDDGISQSDVQASEKDAAEKEECVTLPAAAATLVTPSQESSPSVVERAPIQMQTGISASVSSGGATVRKSTSSLSASPSLAENINMSTSNDVNKMETNNTGSSNSGRSEVDRSVTPTWSSPVHANEMAAGRKRKRSPATPTTPKVSLSPSRRGGSGGGCGAYDGNAGRVAGPAIGVAAPDLSLDDLAELVWDPRAGPRPRGIEPPSAAEIRAGEKIAVGRENDDASRDRLARLDKAMWDRDSALLERVAPSHMEKAMQVLQTCRHDVERAAQMLTVRLGIQVEGLGIRQTRNSRAEKKEQTSHCSRRPGSIGTGLAWRGNGVSTGAPGGGGDGSGACGGTSGGSGGIASTAGGAATTRGIVGGSRKADAQGYTREETKMAGDAFMRYGRDLNAVTKVLGWKKGRVVEYYYCIWKFSPAYQVWKATRHHAGLPGVAGGSQYLNQAGFTSSGASGGGGLLNASSDGMRWRGSRLRTLKTGSSQ